MSTVDSHVHHKIGDVEYEGELYAERLRREAQAAALAAGTAQWTDELIPRVRVMLKLAWDDTVSTLGPGGRELLVRTIENRTLRSLGYTLEPDDMKALIQGSGYRHNTEQLLSLIEAEHEALKAFEESRSASPWGGTPLDSGGGGGFGGIVTVDPDAFRAEINRILEAHIVAFHLHDNSRIVPVRSHEMHNAVVEPTLYLLKSQPRFAAAETAYQKALAEIRNRDAGDAITDAATALQEVLLALGCTGGALGDLLNSARSKGLLKGNDTPLTDAIGKTVDWVSAKRGQGEAHRGDPDIDMSDAWMMVHVVGALMIKLSEPKPASGS